MKNAKKILNLARCHKYKSMAVIIAVVYAFQFYLKHLVRQTDQLTVEEVHNFLSTMDFLAPFLVILILIPVAKKPQEPDGKRRL